MTASDPAAQAPQKGRHTRKFLSSGSNVNQSISIFDKILDDQPVAPLDESLVTGCCAQITLHSWRKTCREQRKRRGTDLSAPVAELIRKVVKEAGNTQIDLQAKSASTSLDSESSLCDKTIRNAFLHVVAETTPASSRKTRQALARSSRARPCPPLSAQHTLQAH